MATLPFALTGGVWMLYLLGYHQSVATGVGFIALLACPPSSGGDANLPQARAGRPRTFARSRSGRCRRSRRRPVARSPQGHDRGGHSGRAISDPHRPRRGLRNHEPHRRPGHRRDAHGPLAFHAGDPGWLPPSPTSAKSFIPASKQEFSMKPILILSAGLALALAACGQKTEPAPVEPAAAAPAATGDMSGCRWRPRARCLVQVRGHHGCRSCGRNGDNRSRADPRRELACDDHGLHRVSDHPSKGEGRRPGPVRRDGEGAGRGGDRSSSRVGVHST